MLVWLGHPGLASNVNLGRISKGLCVRLWLFLAVPSLNQKKVHWICFPLTCILKTENHRVAQEEWLSCPVFCGFIFLQPLLRKWSSRNHLKFLWRWFLGLCGTPRSGHCSPRTEECAVLLSMLGTHRHKVRKLSEGFSFCLVLRNFNTLNLI